MTAGQSAVLEAIKEYGPITDAALVPLVQHVANVQMSSSGIRTRRSELRALRKIKSAGSVRMPSGRQATLWTV